jgi:hypothetical protein
MTRNATSGIAEEEVPRHSSRPVTDPDQEPDRGGMAMGGLMNVQKSSTVSRCSRHQITFLNLTITSEVP